MSHDQDSDSQIDALLRDYFARELGRQVGRAETHFRQHQVQQKHMKRQRRVRLPRLLGIAGGFSVAAAICGAIWLGPRGKQPAGITEGTPQAVPPIRNQEPKGRSKQIATHKKARANVAPATSKAAQLVIAEATTDAAISPASQRPLLIERSTRSRTVDEGTVLIGQTPVRKLRRQWLERIEWFDPEHGAYIEQFVPHEEFSFVALPVN